MNESFVFYKSFYEAAAALEPADRLAFYEALAEYAICGEDPDIESPVARAMFIMAKPQLDANEKRRENGQKGGEYGKLGGRPRKENPIGVIDENPIGVSDENPLGVSDKTPNVNVNANANVNANVKEKRGGRFAPPTLAQLKEECTAKGYTFDPEAFMSYYEANGWKVGRNPMRNWKAAARNWQARENKDPPKKPKAAYNNFSQRQYDYAALEKQILRG